MINSFTSCIRNGVDKSLFVDDVGVSYRSKHMQATERQLQLYQNRIEDWADDNGFYFSQFSGIGSSIHCTNSKIGDEISKTQKSPGDS